MSKLRKPMTKTFTEDDVLRFVYEELNEDEQQELTDTLQSDVELRSSLEQLNEAKTLLDGLTIKAPSDVVARILYASKNLQSA